MSTSAQPRLSLNPTVPHEPRVVRVDQTLLETAVARLLGDRFGDSRQGVRQFLAGAKRSGIDLSLMWASVHSDTDAHDGQPGEVCLLVPGGGRTGMMFSSTGDASPNAHIHRVAVLQAAVEFARTNLARHVRLVQSLPDPSDTPTRAALTAAGFVWVGDLMYLKRRLKRNEPDAPSSWPSGITVRAVRTLEPGSADRADLSTAMNTSYIETLDCPELCGLRETHDVIDSHRGARPWEPGTWWIVHDHGTPSGCMLLNVCPDHDTVDLVYLGLGPALRGRGLGSHLLRMGISVASRSGMGSMTCAVDRRNVPAIRMYERLGFSMWSERVALVRPIESPSDAAPIAS